MISMKKSIASFCSILCILGLTYADKSPKTCTPVDCKNGYCEPLPCYHGNCLTNGSCSCDSCWEGETCQDYVDEYPSLFESKSYIVNVKSPTKTIFKPDIYDEDTSTTCRNEVDCLCVKYNLKIVPNNENEDIFRINNKEKTVELIDYSLMSVGRSYTVKIQLLSYDNLKIFDTMELIAVAKSLYDEVDNLEMMDEEDVHSSPMEHSIAKRGAVGTTTDTTIMFLRKKLPVSTQVTVGDKLEFNFEMWMPQTSGMTLLTEIFTSDPENNTVPMHILSCTLLQTTGGEVTLQPLNKKISALTAAEIDGLFTFTEHTDRFPVIDRVTVNFGTVVNSEAVGADNTSSLITLNIKALALGIYPKTIPNQYFSAGAEFDTQKFLWISQQELQFLDKKDFLIGGTITGPDTIAANSMGVFEIEMTITEPSADPAIIEISTLDMSEGVASIGLGYIKNIGANFLDKPSWRAAISKKERRSANNDTVLALSLNLGLLINTRQTAPDSGTDSSNKITVVFGVFVLGSVAANTPITVISGFVVSGNKVWTEQKKVTVTPPGADPIYASPTVKVVRPAESIPPSGVANVALEITVPLNQNIKGIIESTTASFKVCGGAVMDRGLNILYVPAAKLDATTNKLTCGPVASSSGGSDTGKGNTYNVLVSLCDDGTNTGTTTVNLNVDGVAVTTPVTIMTTPPTTPSVSILASTFSNGNFYTGTGQYFDVNMMFTSKPFITIFKNFLKR